MIHFVIFVIFFISSLSISYKSSKSLNILILGSVLLFIPILSFLVGVNGSRLDIDVYIDYFKNSPDLFNNNFIQFTKQTHTEIGYDILTGLFKIISNSASLFFIFFCLFSLIFRYKFYQEFIPLRDLCLVFFAFLANEFLKKDCVQIRNGLASAIVLYSLLHLYKGYRLKFLFFVLLACCIQLTAIVAMPLFFVQNKFTRNYWKFLLFIFLFSLFICFLFPIKKVFFLFDNIGILPHKIKTYLYYDQFSHAMSITNPMLLKQTFFVLFFLFHKKKIINNEKIFFFFQIYLLSTIYYLVFRDFEILAGRFGSLLYGVEPILLYLYIEKEKKNIVLKKCIILSMYLVFFLMNYYTDKTLGFSFNFC